ncbi:MAG TPA: hypothetical protein VMA86_09340 [Acetobacteraceae bacterium]|nr:hypothetical protein [Acetobacteraceae bacterium]
MRRIILHMIATNALAAFSVQPASIGAARPIVPARAESSSAAGNAANGTASSAPQQLAAPAIPQGGKILPRGSLLDLSV